MELNTTTVKLSPINVYCLYVDEKQATNFLQYILANLSVTVCDVMDDAMYAETMTTHSIIIILKLHLFLRVCVRERENEEAI